MYYELWDFESGNIIGSFDTQNEALRIVREVLDTYGIEEAMHFGLGAEDYNGESRAIAHGAELVDLARLIQLEARENA